MKRLLEKVKSVSPRTTAILLGLLAVLLYTPAMFGDYIYDDHDQVEHNQWIDSASHMPLFFKHATAYFHRQNQPPANYYRPMHMLTYWGTRQVLGHQPWSYHLINIVLYGFIVAMFFLLARKWLSPATALFATALFMAAPYHVETVGWIAAVPELFGTCLMLIVILLHFRANSTWWQLVLLFVFYLSALLMREHALILPGLLIAYDWLWKRWKNSQVLKHLLLHYLLIGSALIIYFMLRTNALGFVLTDKAIVYPLSWGEIIINWPVIVLDYLYHMVIVQPYSGFYIFEPVLSIVNLKFSGAVIILAALVILGIRIRNKETMVTYYLLWTGLGLIPFLYLPALGENILTDRYMFLSSVGICMLLAWLLKNVLDLIKNRWLSLVFQTMMVMLVLVWTGSAIYNMSFWKNDISWCEQTLKVEPRAYFFHNLMGEYYYSKKQYQQALLAYAGVEKKAPDHIKKPLRTEQVAALGRHDRIFKQAYFDSLKKKASVFFELQEYDQVLAIIQELIKVYPYDDELYYKMGKTYQALGNLDLAKQAFEESLLMRPENNPAKIELNALIPDAVKEADVFCSQAKLCVDKRQFEEAEALLNQAISLAPDYDQPYHYLFNLYWLLEDKIKAKRAILEAIKRNPDNRLYLQKLKTLEP